MIPRKNAYYPTTSVSTHINCIAQLPSWEADKKCPHIYGSREFMTVPNTAEHQGLVLQMKFLVNLFHPNMLYERPLR
jgi:hypothetical protein